MQLWKKNFLVTYFLFLMIIYGGLMLLDFYISKNELAQWSERAAGNEKSIFYLASVLKDENLSRKAINLETTARQYQELGIYLKITINHQVMTDSLPLESMEEGKTGILKQNGKKYLLLHSSNILEEASVIDIIYAENLQPLTKIQLKRLLIFCIAGAVFSFMIGSLLYYTMKRINRPINQIAHELRTPLTGIRGYAEYMMLGNLTEEDRFFASEQIAESAKSLEAIIEKLLIMGNVKEGTIQKKKLNPELLFNKIQKKYPDIEIDWKLEKLYADETLADCLLENLVANAVHAGNHVKLQADSKAISIWNDGKIIDPKTLKSINKNQNVTNSNMDRHGYGIRLCQEIAAVHGWKLMYHSKEGEGTVVILTMHK